MKVALTQANPVNIKVSAQWQRYSVLASRLSPVQRRMRVWNVSQRRRGRQEYFMRSINPGFFATCPSMRKNTSAERVFPSGAAWAHASLVYDSSLPDHGLISAKTKLLQRVEDEATGEKILITLTTPDTREVDGEELLFTMQAREEMDEEGRKRTGLAVPIKPVSTARRSWHRGLSRGRRFLEGVPCKSPEVGRLEAAKGSK